MNLNTYTHSLLKKIAYTGGLFLLCCLSTAPVHADAVQLQDGSRLVGKIKSMANDVLVMDTAFAKGLQIAATQIVGLSSEGKLMVELSSGDRLAGQLQYSADRGQSLSETTFGNVELGEDITIRAIGARQTPGLAQRPTAEVAQVLEKQQAEHQAEVATIKAAYNDELDSLRKEKARLRDPWSGNIALGISGKQGNTDSFNIAGRGEATRDTGFDRVYLYVEGNLEQQNSVTSTNEVLAGASLEHDLSERWFVFGSADFEKDEFENLDLRGVAKVGAGYFFIRDTHMFLKGQAGLGYQHESFNNGTTLQEGIVSLGSDFEYKYSDWWKLGHKLTYFPSITSPASDYRLVSSLFTELPLVNTELPWKLRFSVRNDYDSQPRTSIKKLDTSYLLNIVYNFK